MNVIKKGFMMIGVVIVVAVVLIAGSNVMYMQQLKNKSMHHWKMPIVYWS